VRKEAQEKAVRNMTFRIQGLPLDADQKELFDALNLIGFGLDDKDSLRAMYDNYGGHVVRNGIVMFRVPCKSEQRRRLADLTGEQHVIELAGIEWKIKVNCFGFCIGCKKEGHKIQDCLETVKKCFYCKIEGHERKTCPDLKKKKENSQCYKCKQTGHFSSECTNNPIGWKNDLEFPELDQYENRRDYSNLVKGSSESNVASRPFWRKELPDCLPPANYAS